MTVAKPIGHHVGALLGWMYIVASESCLCHTTGGLPWQEMLLFMSYHWRPPLTGNALVPAIYYWRIPSTGNTFVRMPVNPCRMAQN